MYEMYLNRTITVNPQGRFLINNQEVDFDMFIIEEEAINLLEEELMEGQEVYHCPDEEDYHLSEIEEFYQILDEDSLNDEDNFFRGGYFDISTDDFDVKY